MKSEVIQLAAGPIYIGEIVGSKFVTEKLLAARKTSTVFIARSKGNQEAKRVALKVQPIDIQQSTLNNDITVLKNIGGKEHFPKVYEQGTHMKFSFVALELLGPTLSDIMKRRRLKKLSLSSVAKVGIQGLEALSTLHSAGFVHCKVCLENFAIGYTKETAGNIYLIDFTQSKRIDDKNLLTENKQNSENQTNQDRLNIKLKLVQNDLQCLLKLVMALYHGVEENQVDFLNSEIFQFNDYDQIQSEIIQLNTQISKIDIENIGYYEGLILVLRMIAESNGGNLNNPFEWETQIDQLSINEMKQYNDNAMEFAQQSIPQIGEQFKLDISTLSLLQVSPKNQRQMQIQEQEHHQPQTMDQFGQLRSQNSLLNIFSPTNTGSQSHVNLLKLDQPNKQQVNKSNSYHQIPKIVTPQSQTILNPNNQMKINDQQIISPPINNFTRFYRMSSFSKNNVNMIQQQQLLKQQLLQKQLLHQQLLQQQQILQPQQYHSEQQLLQHQQSQPGYNGLLMNNSKLILNKPTSPMNQSPQQLHGPILRQRSNSSSSFHGAYNQGGLFSHHTIHLDQQHQLGLQQNNMIQPQNMNQNASSAMNFNRRNSFQVEMNINQGNQRQNPIYSRQRSASFSQNPINPFLSHNQTGLISPQMLNQLPHQFQNQEIQPLFNYNNIQLKQQKQQPKSYNTIYQQMINAQQMVKDSMQQQQQQHFNIPRQRNVASPHDSMNNNDYFNKYQLNDQQQQGLYSHQGFEQSSTILEPVIEQKNPNQFNQSEALDKSSDDKHGIFSVKNSTYKNKDVILNKDSIKTHQIYAKSPSSNNIPIANKSLDPFLTYFDPFDIIDDDVQTKLQSNQQDHTELPSQDNISINPSIRMSQKQLSKLNSQEQLPQAAQQTIQNKQNIIQSPDASSYSNFSPQESNKIDLLQTPESTNQQLQEQQKSQKPDVTSPLQEEDGSKQHSQYQPHLLYQQHPFFSQQLSTAVQPLHLPDTISTNKYEYSNNSNNNSDNQKLQVEWQFEQENKKNNNINQQQDSKAIKVQQKQRRKVISKQESPTLNDNMKVIQIENEKQNIFVNSIQNEEEKQIEDINKGEQLKFRDINQSSPQKRSQRKKIQSLSSDNIQASKEQLQQQLLQSGSFDNIQQLNTNNGTFKSIDSKSQISSTLTSNSSLIPLNKTVSSQNYDTNSTSSQQSLLQPDNMLQKQQSSPTFQTKSSHMRNLSSPNSQSFYQSSSLSYHSPVQAQKLCGSPLSQSSQQYSQLNDSISQTLTESSQLSSNIQFYNYSSPNQSSYSPNQSYQQQLNKNLSSPLKKVKRIIYPIQATELSPKPITLTKINEQNLNSASIINQNKRE